MVGLTSTVENSWNRWIIVNIHSDSTNIRTDMLLLFSTHWSLQQSTISTYAHIVPVPTDSGAVTCPPPPTHPPAPHATLQHLLHNLCCDWQASINLSGLCSIIISPAVQLDSTQRASRHTRALQKKFPVSRQDCRSLLQCIFYSGACQYNCRTPCHW